MFFRKYNLIDYYNSLNHQSQVFEPKRKKQTPLRHSLSWRHLVPDSLQAMQPSPAAILKLAAKTTNKAVKAKGLRVLKDKVFIIILLYILIIVLKISVCCY